MSLFKISLFTLFVVLSQIVLAQQVDSLDYNFSRAILGNRGSNSFSLLYNHKSPSFIGDNQYLQYSLQGSLSRDRITDSSFSNVRYLLGTPTEQDFEFNHKQKLGSQIDLVFDFKKLKSGGFYQNQENNHQNVRFEANYQTKNEAYQIHPFAVFNKLGFQENGGIADPLDFEENFIDNRAIMPVNISATNTMKNNFYGVQQNVRLFKGKDSLVASSFELEHLIMMNKKQKRYLEDLTTLPLFYDNIYLDSTLTNDSILQESLLNELRFNYKIKKDSNLLMFSPYGSYEDVKYNQNQLVDSSYINLYAGLDFSYLSESIEVGFTSKFGVDGYQKGAYAFNANLIYNIDDTSRISLHANLNNSVPEVFLNHYSANNFNWSNNLKNQESYGFEIAYNHNRLLNASVTSVNIVDYIYFGKTASPLQSTELIQTYKFNLFGHLALKNIHLKYNVAYQWLSNENLLPLPDLVSSATLYFENYLFKKALKFRLGGDVWYFSDYVGYDYNPATAQFYLSSSSEKIGAYPYLNGFLNLYIKRAKLFFRVDHFNSGFFGYNYYTIQNYSMPDRTFKFGIEWKFLD